MAFAFIDPNARVQVTEGEDTVTIVGKLSKRQRGLVQQELIRLQLKMSSNGDEKGDKPISERQEEAVYDATFSAHLHELALLKAAVVDWDGPSFRFENGTKVPCTGYWLEKIDPDEPIWTAVLQEIDRLNTPRTVPPQPVPPAPKEANTDPNGLLGSGISSPSITDGIGG